MYRVICYSCGQEEIIREFDQAQEYFNDHADRECHVELFNLSTTRDSPTADSDQFDTSGGASPAEE